MNHSDPSFRSLVEQWDGEAVLMRFDRPTASWMFIALHSSALGPPMGGTRLRHYPSPAAGLLDAMRLAEGMTHKWAALNIPYGGGKGVLAVPGALEGEARQGLLRRYGKLVASLRGAFSTGEDLGTTPEDMAVIAQETCYVHGVEGEGKVRDPGPFTARGVLHGMEAAAREVLGRSLDGLVILIQGVGDVGRPLGVALRRAGARLLVTDLDTERLEWAAGELDAAVVPTDVIYETACDVFAPCAVGGVLNPRSIPRLACRMVAGSANNQLESEEDALLLHQRGITYVPDYVINAGGALAFALHGQGERDPQVLMEAMSRVGVAVSEVLAEAREHDETPLASARRRVERALARSGAAEGPETASAVGASGADSSPSVA